MNSSILVGITVLKSSVFSEQHQASVGGTDIRRDPLAWLLIDKTNARKPARFRHVFDFLFIGTLSDQGQTRLPAVQPATAMPPLSSF